MREESTLRIDDERMADEVSAFLDAALYDSFTTGFSRVTDRNRQVAGIDVIFDYNGEHYTCDEKSAVRYRNLNTFALELSFVNRAGRVTEGWLTNPKDINNSYMFIWLDTVPTGKMIECALVRKDVLLDYLDDLGWSPEKLRAKCDRIRRNAYEPLGDTRTMRTNGCKFTYSTHLVEEPINILLPRTAYESMAEKVWKFNC